MAIRSPVVRRVSGPLLALLAIATIELLAAAGWRIPTAALLLPAVIFATVVGGLGNGLFTALLSSAYFFYYHHTPGSAWLDELSPRPWVSTVATLLVVPIIELFRRRLAAEREHMEATLDRILSAADSAFVMLDQDWRFTYVNRRAEQLWNRRRSDLLGRSFWNAFPHMAGTDLHEKLAYAAEHQQPVALETTSCVAGNWVELSAWPSGSGLSIYFRDVTDRKHDEEVQRLRLAINQRLRDLELPGEILAAAARTLGEHLHATRVVYTEVDPEQHAFVVTHEYRAHDVPPLRKHWNTAERAPNTLAHLESGQPLRIDDADNQPGLDPVVSDILGEMGARALIVVPLLRDQRFAASLAVHDREPRQWSQQEIALVEEVAGWTRQAVERARAEQALRESREWLRFTLEATRVGTWDWHIDTGRVLWSANLEAIHGLTSGAFAGNFESYFYHVLPDDQQGLRQALQQAQDHDQPLYAEYRVIGSDQAIRWMEAKGKVIHDEHNRPIRMVGTCTEVTHRKRIERSLQDLNENLEQRVAQRTLELRALAAQLSDAEQRERSRLARVLHDHLQQLLVAAKIRIASLPDRVPPQLQQELRTAHDLLRQAIDASRSLAVELSPPILQQKGLVAALRWLAEQQRSQYGLDIRLEIQHDLPEHILAEVVRNFLFQAVRELLLNVVKHSGADHAEVRITAVDGTIEVVVEDHGKGCDPAAATDQRESGTGFGLASIRHRIELLGGRFEMQTVPGGGCRTIFTVPTPPT